MAFKKAMSVFNSAVFLLSCFSFYVPEVSAAADYGIVSQIKNAVPSSAGYVSDYNISNSGPVLIYIQDLHCNPGVQKNISEILVSLDEKIGVGKVILEGVPEGKVLKNALKAFPQDVKYKIIENLLGSGLVSGAELYSLQNYKDNLYGIENWDRYVSTLYLAAELTGKQKYEAQRIASFKKAVEKNVSRKIKRFASVISEENYSKFKDFRKLSKTYGKPMSGYPNFSQHVELSFFADKLDYKKAQKELASYLEHLKNVLPYKEYRRLESASGDKDAYFEILYDAGAQTGLADFISKYPNLYSFLAYSKKSKGIVPLLAYNEEKAYSGVLFNEASKDAELRENLMIYRMTSLLEPFVCASMTEKDFLYFSANAASFAEAVERRFPQYAPLISAITQDARFFGYYAGNIIRNSFFLENIKKYNSQTSAKINVAIAGGFHSSIVEDLKASGISYAVISPSVKSAAGSGVYNGLLSINYSKKPNFSGLLMSNALAPIPLMLAANSQIPLENRESYTAFLVDALAFEIAQSKDGRKILVSPEKLKSALGEWAKELSADLNVTYDENSFTVVAGGISLSYGIKNGYIEIEKNVFDLTGENQSVKEPLFSVSYIAASSAIESLLKDFFKDFTNYAVNILYEAKYMGVKREYYSESPLMKKTPYSSLIKLIEGRNQETIDAMKQELLKKGDITIIPVVVSGKEIEVVVETEFLKNVDLTEADISSAISNALKRTSSAVKSSDSALNDVIYIAPYDKSPSLFFGNIDFGIIGVNKALYDIENESFRKSLFKTGFTHEIRHNFYGHIADRTLLDSFEEAANLQDVRILFEEVFANNAQRENESVGDYQNRIKDDVVYKLSQVLGDASSSSKIKDRGARFLSKVKNYIFEIDDISILLNRKDLKDGDIWHIISEYVDSDLSDVLEKLKNEREYYLDLSKKAEARIGNLKAEAASIPNRDIYDVIVKSISELKESRKSYLREAAQRAKEIKKEEKKQKSKIPEMEANQEYIFSNAAPMDANGRVISQPLSFEEYMAKAEKAAIGNAKNRSGIITGAVIKSADRKIAAARSVFENSLSEAGFSPAERQKLLENYDKNCKAALRLMYYNLPEHFFRRYFTDSTSVKNHGFSHSVEVLTEAFKILPKDVKLIEALKKGEIDMTVFALSAFMHDMSNIISRHNHERNSVYMINALLNNASGISLYEEDGQGKKVFAQASGIIRIDAATGKAADDKTAESDIISVDAEKLKEVSLGHSKIKENEIRDEHNKHLEAGLLHDADAFSAIFSLGRILDIYIAEGSPIFNKDLTLKKRIALLMRPNFTEGTGDALNEIMRHGYARKDPALFVTDGAKIIVENSGAAGVWAIKDFIDSSAARITAIKKIKTRNLVTVYSETDIEDMKRAADEIAAAYNKVLENGTYEELLDDDGKYERTSPKPEFTFGNMVNLINLKNGDRVKIPKNVVISDVHGAAERFDALLKSMLNIGKDEILTPRLLQERLVDSTIDTLYVLGDNQDRGPDPITVFRLVKAIKYSGKGKFVTGNHDINALMNVLGLHLPFYRGFNGIRDDYTVSIPSSGGSVDGEITLKVRERLENEIENEENYRNMIRNLPAFKNMTAEEREAAAAEYESNIKGYTEKQFWANEFAKYVEWAQDNQQKWEGALKEAVSVFEGLYGEKTIDMKKGNDILNFPENYPDSYSSPVVTDEILRDFWKDILGHNVGTIVFRGLRDVNKMSLNWWRDKRVVLEELAERYPLNKGAWDEMAKILEDIIKEQEKRLRDAYARGNWEQLVVDSIMYRNFESVEWYAYDWIFHSSWGDIKSGFLAVRNKELAEKGETLLTNSTYIQDPLFVELMEFYKDNFNLYEIDGYGAYLLHSMLPVNEDGEVSIGKVNETGQMQIYESDGRRIEGLWYKGVHYKGRAVFDGLYKMAVDIRMFDYNRPLAEITEAFTLINSIYADSTTNLKPQQIAGAAERIGKRMAPMKMQKPWVAPLTAGLTEIMDKIAVPILFAGHNTISKLNKVKIDEIVLDSDGRAMIINVDDDMSPKYGGRGSYKVYNAQIGILKSGFEGADDDVKTFVKDKIVVSKEDFIGRVEANLIRFQDKILVSKEDFIGRIEANLIRLLLEMQRFRIDNSVVLNLDLNEVGTGKEKVEKLKLKGVQGYNLEVVTSDSDSQLISSSKDVMKKEIEVLGRVFDIEIFKIDGEEAGTNAYKVKIPYTESAIPAKYYGDKRKFKELVLTKAAILIISSQPDKKFIIRTSSMAGFESLGELPAASADRMLFLTENRKKGINTNVSRLEIQKQMLNSLAEAFGAELAFEMLPFADYEEKEGIVEKTQSSSPTQSILSAA
jgi:hypothetical protein